jgi:hypothetical protein
MGHLDLRDIICDDYYTEPSELEAAARFGNTQMVKEGLRDLISHEDFYLVQWRRLLTSMTVRLSFGLGTWGIIALE